MYGYLKLRISDKKMSKLMYAILITKSKLVNCHHLGLGQYTRKQNSGHYVDLVVELKEDQVQNFEKLAEVKLKTSKEFQGEMVVN